MDGLADRPAVRGVVERRQRRQAAGQAAARRRRDGHERRSVVDDAGGQRADQGATRTSTCSSCPAPDHAARAAPYGDRKRFDFFVQHLLGVDAAELEPHQHDADRPRAAAIAPVPSGEASRGKDRSPGISEGRSRRYRDVCRGRRRRNRDGPAASSGQSLDRCRGVHAGGRLPHPTETLFRGDDHRQLLEVENCDERRGHDSAGDAEARRHAPPASPATCSKRRSCR